MQKIILNKDYGGYGWSGRATLELLDKKGILTRLARWIWNKDSDYVDIPSTNFLDADGQIASNHYILVRAKDVSEYNGPEPDRWVPFPGFHNREDPDLIKLLEEKGSRYCSDKHATLGIEEYDENDWLPRIEEYDGIEWIRLIPKVTERQIRECGDIDKVVSLLRRLGIFDPAEKEKWDPLVED